MTVIEDGRLVWMLIALLVGAAASAWVAHRVLRRRFDTRLRQATDALQQQHGAVVDRFRAAHARLHTEHELQRAGTARQVAAATAEPRATISRLQERLNAAYAELDRIREASGDKPGKAKLDDHGFAATQPMHSGM